MTSARKLPRRVTRLRATASACVVIAGLLGAMTAGCTRRTVKVTLPTVPATMALREFTATTKGIDHSRDTLAPAAPTAETSTTTSTIAFAEGKVTISGTVLGPDGGVAGATVRLERLVGDQRAVREVLTDARGRYTLKSVTAGRIRFRAWRVPDMAATEETVAFASGEFKANIKVAGYGTASIRWGIAPSLPVLGRLANVVIQVTTDVVGIDGSVRPEPVVGVGMIVTPIGLLQPEVVQDLVTGDRGRVQLAMRCNGVGASTLLVELATGERAELSPPACIPVPTTTAAPIVVPDPADPAVTVPVQAANTVPEAEPTATVVVKPAPEPVGAAATVAPPNP